MIQSSSCNAFRPVRSAHLQQLRAANEPKEQPQTKGTNASDFLYKLQIWLLFLATLFKYSTILLALLMV